ncbi:MAG: thioredoxin [Deltaproteobacteria bacterium]|nr:thioredoxin [Deltaproteobacteria bacterium]
MASPNITELTDQAFQTEVLDAATPVLVDFWAPWCAPCRAIAPDVEALAQAYSGKVKVCKLNVDDNPNTPTRYNVRGIPTLLVFKNGKVADQIVGRVAKAKLEEMIKKQL